MLPNTVNLTEFKKGYLETLEKKAIGFGDLHTHELNNPSNPMLGRGPGDLKLNESQMSPQTSLPVAPPSPPPIVAQNDNQSSFNLTNDIMHPLRSGFNILDHTAAPLLKHWAPDFANKMRPGWQGMRNELKANPNTTFDSTLMHGEGAMESKGLDAMNNQTGVVTNRDQYGALDQNNPVNVEKTIPGVINKYTGGADNMWDKVKGWIGDNYHQFMNNPTDWIGKNPWLAGGGALLGGLGVYGAGKMLGGLFGGGEEQHPQQQQGYGQPYGVPNPQAIQKYGGDRLGVPLLTNSFGMPGRIASLLAGPSQNQQFEQPQQPQAYEPHFSTEDAKLRKALDNPKMQEYLINLLQHNGQ